MMMRRMMHSALVLIMLMALASCAQQFQSPVEPWADPPETTDELAAALDKLHGPADNLFSRSRITVSRKNLPGKFQAVFYSIYLAPDNAMLKVDDHRLGEFFRITQRGEKLAVSLAQEGLFFVGEVEELDMAGDMLFGLQPSDVATAVRAGAALVEGMRQVPGSISLPDEGDEDWKIALQSKPDRIEVYFVGRDDGLVRRLEVGDGDRKLLLAIDYDAYEKFEEKVFPSQFTIEVKKHKIVINVEMERVRLGRVRGLSSFPLEPPRDSGIVVRPLSEWLRYNSGEMMFEGSE
jgi:hypothetical protein